MIRINKLLGDDINKVNREATAKPVKISIELFEVLQTGIDYCKLSKGTFDITIDDSNAPSGYEKLVLNEKAQTVRFAAASMQLNLGGIAKGYAIDKAVEIMKRKGARGGLVDAGGVIRCFGRTARGSSWFVSLGKIKSYDDANENGMVLKLKDCAAAARPDGVTIIAQRAVDAEVIATAVSAMGPEKGLELVDSLLGVEAIIATEGNVIKTDGAESYIAED